MPTTYTITRPNDASYDFTINLDAAFATATTIRWEIVPTEGEFPSASFSGTIDFDTSQTEQRVPTGIIRNHIFPRDFEIRLYDDADNTNTPLHTSGAQSVAGDSNLVGGNLVFAGGNDDNVLGLGFTDDVGSVTGGAGDDVLVITRFQYGDVSINDTDALIKFDFGVTITDYAERSVSSRGSTSILRATLTLDTGAEIEITSPTRPGYGYQLGDSAMLDYGGFKAVIDARDTNDDSQLGPDADYTYTIANPTPAPFVDDAPFSFDLSSYIFGVESGNTAISTLTATDSTSLMPVRYSIASEGTSGGDSALFSIDETSGALSLVNALDYATTAQKRYTLTVNAHADGDTVSTQVVVYLLEVDGDLSAAIGSLTFAGGSNDDIFVAASDNSLKATGGAGDDVLVITRFQYGTVSINETDALIKFDYEVTITDYAERSVSSRGSTSILLVTLTLDTGAEIEITSPTRPGYGYQLGDDAVLDYDAFKAAIKATGTNETSDLAGDYTVPDPSSAFDIITGDVSVFVDEGETGALVRFKALLASDTTADVAYSITAGNADGMFRFEKNANGEFVLYLVSGKKLDFEDPNIANFYELTVQLSASGVEPETVPVTISVNDVNDEIPVLADVGGVRTATIVENVEGADAGDISFTVTDADAGSSFTADSFTISAGADTSSDTAEKFEVVRDGNNWDLKVLTTDDNGDPVSLDYETDGTSGTINLNVRVNDGDNDSNVIPITITVTNLNDNNPVLSTQVAWESTYATEVSENTPSGTHLFSVVGTDADNPPSLSYRIISINDETYDQNTSPFAIDAGNGMVGLQSNLDFETTESHKLVIQVFDEDNKASNEVEVTVTVADANDNAPTLTPSATTATLTEQTSLNARAADVATLTVADVDSVGGGTIMASDFVVYAGASGTTLDKRFEVVDVGGTWTLRLKANAGLDYEEEISDSDPTFMVRVGVNDGTNTPIPSAPITITVQNRNDAGTIEITRNPIVKTLTATLTDQDGILTAADGGGASDPSYEWFDVATSEIVSASEIVSTDATYTYTDDTAHYSVRVNYHDNFGTYTLTASIAPLPFYFYRDEGIIAENDASKSNAALILVARNDGSIIAAADIEAAVFVTEDGTTATTHKGFTISTKNLAFGSIGLGTASNWGLNYEALTPDEQENGISLVIRTTYDGTTIDFNFNAKIADRPESVIFDDGVGEVDYTDYLKTITLPDGAYSTTDMVHNAVATATSGGAITYSLIGTDAGVFDIDPTSGVVTFKADTTLDASTKDSYQFEVVATETGTSNIERQSVTITVVGENGIALALSASGSAIITENAPERDTGISFTITDDGTNNVFNSGSFTISAGAGTIDATADKFIIVQNGNAWDLRLKTDDGSGNLARLDYETDGTTGTINLNVKVNDGVVDSNPVPITITLTNLNEAGVVVITRNTTTKTLTATLSDDDGVGSAADGGGAIDPTYEWYNVATGAIVRTASTTNTFTYTDDDAHYRVRVEYTDGFAGVGNVEVEGSTAPISLAPISVQLGEHTTASVPLTAKRTSDGSTIAADALTLAFVLEDGSIANTYKGITISDTGIMPESAAKLNYEALTDDEKTNGIDFTIRATSGTDSVDAAFKVRIADTPESVSFGDDYTDYIPIVNVLDGTSYTTTDAVHTAAATATGAITYALGGTDAGLFDIGTNGAVTFKSATTLAASTKSTYEFTVTATDGTTSDTEHQSVTLNAKSIVFRPDGDLTVLEPNVDSLIANRFSSSGNKFAAESLNYETTGTSTRPTAAVTGGADMAFFEVTVLTSTSTTGRMDIIMKKIDGFRKKHQYEIEFTITNPETGDSDVIATVLKVVKPGSNVQIAPIPGSTPPPITPDRTEEAHDPIDPDDPLAGIVPIPDTDPNG